MVAGLIAASGAFAGSDGHRGHAVDRSSAVAAALRALGVRTHTGAEVVFALPAPVPAGTVVRVGGPRNPDSSGKATRSPGAKVASTNDRAWFFYEDLAPFQQYMHPGRVVLVDARTGRVTVSGPIEWPPAVNGQLPAFLSSISAYDSSAYRVFYRPYSGTAPLSAHDLAQAARLALRDAHAALDPGQASALGALLAAEHACTVRATDSLPGGYYAYAWIAQSRAALDYRFTQLAAHAPGFRSFIYSPGTAGGLSPTAFVARQISNHGCKDVLLYLAGGGYRDGDAVNIGMQLAGGQVLHQDVTSAALRQLISSHPSIDFELVIDAPHASAFQQLGGLSNVLEVATPGTPGGGSFTYLPEARAAGTLVKNDTNPLRLLQLTDRLVFGFDEVVNSSCATSQAEALASSGKLPSLLAYLTAGGFSQGGAVDFVARSGIGSPPEVRIQGFTLDLSCPSLGPPVVTANPDSYTATNDSVLSVAAAHGVLANDTDSAHYPLSVDQLGGAGGSPPLRGSSAKGAAVTINPDGSFTYDPTSSSTLQSLGGNQVTTDSFTYRATDGHGGAATGTVTITVTGIDKPPTITATTPLDGASAVLASETPSVTFSKPVNVTASAFKLECPTGTPTPFTLSPSPPGGATTFTLTPSSSLPAGVTCTVTILASDIADLLGTHLASDHSFSFTVDTPPTVSSTVPADGATNVMATITPAVTFSKPVNVTASAFRLECPTGTPEPFTLSPAPPGGATTFALTPSSPLPAGATCTVTVLASQVADLAGTALGADHSFSFTVDVPPTVSSTTPANGATDVLATTNPSVTFSKPVNVTASAFRLECPTGTPEAFTVSPAPPGGATTFTLTPSSPLPGGATCTVTVLASQVTDLTGTALGADHSFSFTVDTPPSVSSTTPANGTTSVLATTNPSVTFSKPVNVTSSAFTLECPTGTPTAFTLSPAPPGGVTTFTLTPAALLPAGTTCTVTAVASQITDPAGAHPASDFTFSFTVDTPPTVSSTTPANGATSVLATTNPSVTFSKPVNVTASAFTLECPTGTPTAFTLSPAPPGGATTFTLTPSAPLPAGVTCTVTVVAAQVADLAGTALDADHSSSFTVDTRPAVSGTLPADGATSVMATITPAVRFDRPVNVTASAFTLECPTGTPEAFTLSPSPPGGATTFALTPSSPLPAGAVCTVTAVASQITDLAGTHPASDFAFSFTVDTPPTVSSTTPANGATDVLATTNPSVTFSKPVNVTASAFKLECPTGTPEPFTLSPVPPGSATTFTLTPSSPLPPGATCTVTVLAAQVTDLTGTALDADHSFSFTVDTPPSVSTTTPSNGATNVPLNAAPSVTFSKPVNVSASAFTLECPAGTPEAFTLSPSPPGGATTFTLTPSSPLPAGTVCTVTAVASQITDLAGTNLPADFVFTFSTVAAPVAHDYTVSTAAVGNTLFVVGSGTGAPGGPAVSDNNAGDNALSHVTNPGAGCPDFPGTLSLPSSSTANGGTVQMVGTGADAGNFFYEPPAGFTGTDTFKYTVTDSCGSSTATVSIPVQNRVWYVDDSAASNGSGISTSPFNTLSSVSGAGNPSGSGDDIFLFGSSTPYAGGITLKAGQTLVSQSFGLTVNGHSIVAASGANPTITNSGGDGVTVASGDTVEGITVANTSGNGVTASNVPSFTLDSSDRIQNPTGNALDINGGSGTITDGATISTGSSGGHSISIQNRTGGTITNSGNITDGGKGILLSANTGSVIDFAGTIVANTGATPAFSATGGGTVAATGSSSSLSTTTASALNVSGTTIGASGLTFQSISAGTSGSGPARGISLINTGSLGGLTVTGSGTTGGSGGTIQHTSSSGTAAFGSGDGGIYLSGTADVSLTDMNVSSNHASGIYGTGVTNLSLAGDSITSNGTSNTNNDDGIRVDGLTGTGTIATTTVSGSAESDGRIVSGASGSLTMSVTGSTFSTAAKGYGLLVSPNGASVKTTATGNTFNGNFSDGLAVVTTGTGTGAITFVANNNTVTNNTGAGIDLGTGAGIAPTAGFTISGNTVTGQQGSGINVFNGGNGTWTGHVTSNTVGNSAVTNSGSKAGWGIIVKQEGSGTLTADVSNNTVTQIENFNGIEGDADSGPGRINLTITGNNVHTVSTSSEDGIFVNSGALSTDTSTVCLNATGNTSNSPGQAALNGIGADATGFAVQQEFSTTFDIVGPTDLSDNGVQNYLASTNTLSGQGGPSFAGGTFASAASCPTAPPGP